uniref:DJ-1/PfpI domain-containing protein n=1 Tax=Kalanchoe fedtschenkoi TaxID=63787 RepID=A0A7N0U7P1_KALFE
MALRQLPYFRPTLTPLLRRSAAPLSSNRKTLRISSPVSASLMTSAASRKVLVPIADGTEPMEAVYIIDVLRRAGADVTAASVENRLRVDACHGVKIVADALVAESTSTVFDLIALPGGMPGATSLRDSNELQLLVKKQAEEGRFYAAVCASPAVALGSWGLLKGLKATCYPSFMEQLASSGVSTVESRVHKEGNVITSRGPGTTMEFAVALVEQLCGKEKAEEVAGPLVMRPNPGEEYTIAEFNSMEWTFDTTPKILVPIANNTEEMEAVTIIDVLRRAKANKCRVTDRSPLSQSIQNYKQDISTRPAGELT